MASRCLAAWGFVDSRGLGVLIAGFSSGFLLAETARVLVAGSYYSLWDMLWYGRAFPGILGLLAFAVGYAAVHRLPPRVLGLMPLAYSVVIALEERLLILHLPAALVLPLAASVAWRLSLSGAGWIVLGGLLADLSLRLLLLGAAPEDVLAGRLVVSAASASLGLALLSLEGPLAAPGWGVYLAVALGELGVIYPNAILSYSGVDYGARLFLAAGLLIALASAAPLLLGFRAPPLLVSLLAGALVVMGGLLRLAGLVLAAYSLSGLILGASRPLIRLPALAGPGAFLLLSFLGVSVYVYPYVGLWFMADRMELLIAVALLASALAQARRWSPPGAPRARLRRAALLTLLPLLAVLAPQALSAPMEAPGQGGPVLVASYNVHQGFDPYSRFNGVDVARSIRAFDLVCLQEADRGRLTSGYQDIPLLVRTLAGYGVAYQPAIEGTYGVSIAYSPEITLKAYEGLLLTSLGEQRASIKASLEYRGFELVIVNAHLGLDPGERAVQAGELLELALSDPEALVLCGDLNEEEGEALSLIAKHYFFPGDFGEPTCCIGYPGRARIDYVMVLRGFSDLVEDYYVVELEASDHLPVVAELRLERLAGRVLGDQQGG